MAKRRSSRRPGKGPKNPRPTKGDKRANAERQAPRKKGEAKADNTFLARVLSEIANAGPKGMAFNTLQKRLSKQIGRDDLIRLVDAMVTVGDLIRVDQGRLINPKALGWVVGRLSVTRRGDGFVNTESPDEDDLFVPRTRLGTALVGDRVAARITGRERGRPSGAIMEILTRAHGRTVGQYFHESRHARVVPRAKRLDRIIEVPPLPRADVRDGMWVTVEVSEWTDWPDPLIGRVVEKLGEEDQADVDLPVILAAHGVNPEFPEAALREVEEIPLEVTDYQLKNRKDLRDATILTIDPATAKDFDDALSIKKLKNGNWRLGVHIADVSEHVRPNTALDEMARDRGTSIYPIDKVIPMLPERLSNMVCSLRPDEDSLAMSVFMEIDKSGDFAEPPEMCESVIHSARRLNYGQVHRLFIDEMNADDRDAVGGIESDLFALRDLAKALQKMRTRRGALDLDLPEVNIILDEHRRIFNIVHFERYESHRLVEQCMLAANEAVATYLTKKKIPSLYRIHEEPDLERLARIAPALRSLGLKFKLPRGQATPRDYQTILNAAAEHPAQRIISRLLLRTLMLAKYHPENRGHFGLASVCYTHFTSPIRRYPDLLVHRILKQHLRGEPLPQGNLREVWERELAALANVSSDRERRAERIDKEMTKLKTLQHIEPRVGEETTGIICDVAPMGLWVELDDVPIEGLVPLESLPADWWEFDEEMLTLRGEETAEIWRLAQRVRVKIASVDLNALELDLEIVERL